MAGHFEGLTDAQLDQIEVAMPATKQLIELSIKAKPVLEKLLPIYNQAKPLIDEVRPLADQAMPLVDQATKEWEKIAPVVLMLIDKFANKQKVTPTDISMSGYPWT